MQSGTLRHRVTLQSFTTSPDVYGEPIKTWADLATVWAAVEPLRGREYFQAQQTHAEVSYRVRIRHRADILPTMRVLHAGKTLEILSVINIDERNRELHLMCKELT